MTCLAVQFGPGSEAENARGPRLFFALRKWAVSGRLPNEEEPVSSSTDTSDRSADISLIRRMATKSNVSQDDLDLFRRKLEDSSSFQALYIRQEAGYSALKMMNTENRLRFRMVTQLVDEACVIGPAWDTDQNTSVKQIRFDYASLTPALYNEATMTALQLRVGNVVPEEDDLITRVANEKATQEELDLFQEKVVNETAFHSEVRDRLRLYRAAGNPRDKHRSEKLGNRLKNIDTSKRAKTDDRSYMEKFFDENRAQGQRVNYEHGRYAPPSTAPHVNVKYRWRPLYRPNPQALLLPRMGTFSNNLQRLQFAFQYYHVIRGAWQARARAMEEVMETLPASLGENRYFDLWLGRTSAMLDENDAKGKQFLPALDFESRAPTIALPPISRRSNPDSGLRSTANPDNDRLKCRWPRDLHQDILDLRLSEPVTRPSRSTRHAAAAEMTRASSSSSSVSSASYTSASSQVNLPALNSVTIPTTGSLAVDHHVSEEVDLIYMEHMKQNPETFGTFKLLEQHKVISAISANFPVNNIVANFTNGYRALPEFPKFCDEWVLFYQKCGQNHSWVRDRGIRLAAAIKRVKADQKLPPEGPPLIPGETIVLKQSNSTFEKFFEEDQTLLEDPQLLRPMRFAKPLIEFRRAVKEFKEHKAQWLAKREMEQRNREGGSSSRGGQAVARSTGPFAGRTGLPGSQRRRNQGAASGTGGGPSGDQTNPRAR